MKWKTIIINKKVVTRANKGRGVITLPKKYIGKRVKIIVYGNLMSKVQIR